MKLPIQGGLRDVYKVGLWFIGDLKEKLWWGEQKKWSVKSLVKKLISDGDVNGDVNDFLRRYQAN